MSLGYQAVGWNPQKKRYDMVVLSGLITYLAVFLGLAFTWFPHITIETAIIRAFGTAALILLHVILSIGPLCRISDRFLPLLYNRRHLGVIMFTVAAVHGTMSLVQFHALGDMGILASLFTSELPYLHQGWVPFQPLGALALLILFAMAATSHDFWLANLTAPMWKTLHSLVYVAYVCLVGHVVFGILQVETHPLWFGSLVLGAVWLTSIHLIAARKEHRLDVIQTHNAWISCGKWSDIPEDRAVLVCGHGERIAVFRYDGKISAVSNVCQHQNGPLGEGKIIDGCITCPWHGYQYLPDSGQSPPPFTEKIPTFRTKLEGDIVFVQAEPLPPGTQVPPTEVPK
ncbi:MAG: ferric reductase-like transmembrane domain-containing protein [Acidobacteria bacterium]|nr:ferric reductase-like transmembrane domain-containing protein [Acidobacteriota bacterium]